MKKKKALYHDIRKSFSSSKGRFISIMCLIALGSFALVGLQITGSDMRKTGEHYTQEYNSADLSVIGSMGIDEETEKAISQMPDATIEYGYLKDVVISDTEFSVRVFSATKDISQYEIISGEMPENDSEIALANDMKDDYSIGDKIEFDEKADISGNTVLKPHSYTVVGFVNSTELLSHVNMGQSTAGTGELKGYAVVTEDAFDCDYKMIARLKFSDTEDTDPYSDEYTDLVQQHKSELEKLLADQPEKRLEVIKAEYNDSITDGESKISDAKQQLDDGRTKLDDAEKKIAEAEKQIADSKEELQNKVSEAQSEIDEKEKELQSAKDEIADGQEKLSEAKIQLNNAKHEIEQNERKLDSAERTIQSSEQTLETKKQEYQTQLNTYNEAVSALNQKQDELNNNREKLEQGKSDYETGISEAELQVTQIQQVLQNPELSEEEKLFYQQTLGQIQQQLSAVNSEYQSFIDNTYTPGMATIQQGQASIDEKQAELNSAKQQLDDADFQIASAEKQIADGKAELAQNKETLQQAKNTFEQSQSEYNQKSDELETANQRVAEGAEALKEAKSELAQQKSEGEKKITDAEKELADKKQEYETNFEEYQSKKDEADVEISEHEQELEDAKSELDKLELPTFSVSTRREIPGSEGYRIYHSISVIVDSLADVFPIFMYFVAALVTLTTMTRFVDEERLQCGTLKALGYEEKDIIRKFTLYGLLSSSSGSVIGIVLGHTLLPYIVYNAYHTGFSVPQIELHFYPLVTLVALFLGFLSAVVPAYIVAKKTLKEKPSALLLPKAPSAGSKILLEYIKPVWNNMSFTHKVTARNIFRYKKRMLMTIFGVCGAVTLLFAGLSVQHSIAGINDRQFSDILKYDLIIAENNSLDEKETSEIEDLLNGKDINKFTPIRYEEMNKVAGKKQDKQEIKMIVSQDTDSFGKFISLTDRKSGENIPLTSDGIVISERLSDLLDVKAGDTITINDADNNEYTMKIADIAEMYTGHFIFLNADYYETAFHKAYESNADLIILKDQSIDSANSMANQFMQLDGIKGVVQNTTMINQINTIVQSLNKIMTVLILVAILMAVVILYNLTNINVMERLRELSTIRVLGFYDKEVTLYIYRETILLTFLGIICGYVTGDIFYRYLLAVVPPEEVMFNPALGAGAFIIPLILISVITICLGIVINTKLKKLNMLEALKSVE